MDNSEVLVRAYETLLEFEPLIYSFSIFLGLVFLCIGIFKFASSQKQQSSYGSAIFWLVSGVILLNSMGMINLISESFLGVGMSDTLFATTAAAGEHKELVQLALAGIHAIGFFGFIRGGYLLAKSEQQGGGISSGLVHMIGGVLCLNIEVFAKMLGETLGGQVLEFFNIILA